MDARTFTVGPFMENSYLVRRDGSDRALFIDPGDEAPKLLGALEALGLTLDAILLTHTHIDHVGAVAPVATATGAEVWVPEVEKPVLADINRWVPWPRPVEGLGRSHRPPGRQLGHAARVDSHAGGHAPGDDHRLPRPHGHHDARRRAGEQPLPRRARSVIDGHLVPEKVQAPRGTFDVLPDDGRARLRLLELSEAIFGRANYGPIETPVFEATELFERGVGEP